MVGRGGPGDVKALGRCVNRHTTVVESRQGEMPSGVCARCGETLIEWAVKNADPQEQESK
jgi:hypothetical protein